MDEISFFIKAFVAFFVIIDAVGNVPIFNSLLEGFAEKERKMIIKRAVSIAFLTFLTITLTGKIVFEVLSIEMYSFRVAGGILLMIIAIEMLFGKRSRTNTPENLEDLGADLTVTPLAVPLLAGPGTFTTGIVLFNGTQGTLEQIAVIISGFLAFLISYHILDKSMKIFNALGKIGTRVVVRVMGLMLLAIAVQFMIDGVSEAIKDLALL